MDKLLTIKEVSNIINVSQSTLRLWDKKQINLIPIKTLGKHRRYRQSDIERFMSTYNNVEFNKCCVEEIKRIWDFLGGSMNVIRFETYCPKCNHYIGLTQTNEIEANKLLKKYNLL